MMNKVLGSKRHKVIGQKFGRLSIISYDEKISEQLRLACYLVHCDCGVEKIVKGNSLRSRNLRSCGCLQREHARKHAKKIGSRDKTGENNSRYYHGFCVGRKKFRKIIHNRDKVCQYNGEHKGLLEAHHLDGNNANNDPKNGALLCQRHHTNITLNGNIWRLQ